LDIEGATTLACAMHGSLGLAGPNPLVYLGPGHRAHEFLRFADVREAVAVELADAERVCREMLHARRPALIAVARRLFEHGRIDGWEVERILRPRRRTTSAPDNRPL
jgi:cell division protease FtsH